MAKITCEYDSETKEMVVKVNGEVQEMADSFSCYSCCQDGDMESSDSEGCVRYGSCSINFCCEEKDGIKIYKSAYAKKQLQSYARELLSLNNKKSKNGV